MTGLIMRRWLARLSFSFIILALVLGWDAWRSLRGHTAPRPQWRIQVQFVAAAACVVLGLIGTAMRHRDLRQDGNRNDLPK